MRPTTIRGPIWVDPTAYEQPGSHARQELPQGKLGHSNGHYYDDDLRCLLCGATWDRLPLRCTGDRSALRGQKIAGGFACRLKAVKRARERAEMTEEERLAREEARRARQVIATRKWREKQAETARAVSPERAPHPLAEG